MGAGKAFYDRHLAIIDRRDSDALVTQQYAPDAVIVGWIYEANTYFERKGTAEIKAHFEAYLDRLGYIKLVSTDLFYETNDAIFFEATVEVAAGIAKVYDVFMFNDEGRIVRQFTGLKGFQPKAG